MSWKEVIVRVVTKPWLVVSGVVVYLLHLTGTVGLWEFLSTISAQWFGTLAIGSGFLAPNLAWVPTDAVLGLVSVVALVVFIDKADSTIEWMREKYL